jgi:hypothetical protein
MSQEVLRNLKEPCVSRETSRDLETQDVFKSLKGPYTSGNLRDIMSQGILRSLRNLEEGPCTSRSLEER